MKIMKTIAELSKELNVTPQAIYKKVNKQLKQQLKNHLHKGNKGETLIDEEGQVILRDGFKPVFKLVQQPDLTTVNKLLLEQIKEKDIQITALTMQIEKLTIELSRSNEHIREMNLNLSELNRNNQVLLRQALPQPRWFKKLFGRKDNK